MKMEKAFLRVFWFLKCILYIVSEKSVSVMDIFQNLFELIYEKVFPVFKRVNA
jgi:hypothetical protein